MKRFTAAIVALLALTAQVFAAGSIQLSGTQQFDTLGRPLSGGLLYTFQSGTTTPQSAFQDQALTIAWPNPMVLDASGRAPFFYLADGNIKIRLSDSTGVTLLAADNLLVIGPSFGGGSGGGVDATTILATGDTKARYGTGVLSGFVRANGRTLGSATSGATERANTDAQALFEYLWTTDVNLVVSTGRGLTANADWLANKTITLPDMRGRVLAGLDDMGTTAASRLTTSFFGQTGIVLGQAGGSQSYTITLAQSPSHFHNVSGTSAGENQPHTHTQQGTFTSGASNNDLDHSHGFTASVGSLGVTTGGSSGGSAPGGSTTGGVSGGSGSLNAHTHSVSISGQTSNGSVSHTHTVNINTDSKGGDGAHPIVQPTMVVTFYLKL